MVLFELLRKRFLLASPPPPSPISALPSPTSPSTGHGSGSANTQQIRPDVLATVKDWLTVGAGAQDVLDDLELYRGFREFLSERGEQDPPAVNEARCALLEIFLTVTAKPPVDPEIPGTTSSAITPSASQRFGTQPVDLEQTSPQVLVEDLDSIAYTVFRAVAQSHMFELADILQTQSADRTAWFLAREPSASNDDNIIIQDFYTYIQRVVASPLLSAESSEPIAKLLDPSLRGIIRAHNSIREWIVSKISDPSISSSSRLSRMEVVVQAIAICRSKALLGDPDAFKQGASLPATRSFVEAVLVAAIISPESRAYARTWHEVAGNRKTTVNDVIGLIGPADANASDGKPLTVDLAWIVERMMEVISLPNVADNEAAASAINYDKQRYLYNLIANTAGLTPRVKRTTENDLERLTTMAREAQATCRDLRSMREAAQREMNHMSFPQAGRRLIRPFNLLVNSQHEKVKRDRGFRDKFAKEKRNEQLRAEKRVSLINRAMQPKQVAQKHLRQKKSMSSIHAFFRPLSVAFGASTDKLHILTGPPRTASELDFDIDSAKGVTTLNLVGAGVRNFINDERPYTLQIDTEDGGHFLLQALSVADRDTWLSKLKRVAETSAMKRLTYLGKSGLPQDHELNDPNSQTIDPRGVFGHDILTVLRRESPTGVETDGQLPVLVRACIDEVDKRGLDEVGIYRVAGSKALCVALKQEFNRGGGVDLSVDGSYPDVHIVCDVLRQWFRELPETVFTAALLNKFMDATKIREYEERRILLRSLIWQLPKSNFDLLQALFEHLDRVVDYEEHNHMSPDALAVVFNLSLCGKEVLAAFGSMQFTLALIKQCIVHYHYLFSPNEPEAEADQDEDVQSSESASPPPLPDSAPNGSQTLATHAGASFAGLEPIDASFGDDPDDDGDISQS